MSKTKIIAGLELGSSKIAVLIAQVQSDSITNEASISIVGVSQIKSRGIKKGQIVDIDEAVEATITCVESAERMAGYNLNSAFVSLGGAHISSQNSHGVVAVSDPNGEISQDDVDRVIEAASAVSMPSSREVIHVIPREFIVDGESGVKIPIGMSGTRLEVETHLVTASSAAVKNLKKSVNEVGIDIDGLVFSGLASADSVLTKTEKELGVALVDIGGGTTSVAVFVDGSLCYSGVIPIGSSNVTSDLAIGLRVSLEDAEKIKLSLSKKNEKSKIRKTTHFADQISLSSLGVEGTRKVSQKTLIEGIMRPRLNEIFTMVKLHLEKNNLNVKVPSGVVITGGGAQIVGAEKSAKRTLVMPVRTGKPSGVGGLVDDVITPVFSVPVGLILHGSTSEMDVGLSSLSKRFKFPTRGVFGKFVGVVKDLLP